MRLLCAVARGEARADDVAQFAALHAAVDEAVMADVEAKLYLRVVQLQASSAHLSLADGHPAYARASDAARVLREARDREAQFLVDYAKRRC
jgi:hypothetical protein